MSHLSVVEMVYHQSTGEQPTAVESRYSKELKTDEQPFDRTFKATPEWQPLECGWLDRASQLILSNEEGKELRRRPTKEEQAAIDAKVVELCWAETLENPAVKDQSANAWLVPPGESMRAAPATLKALRIRCRAGVARCKLTLIPA